MGGNMETTPDKPTLGIVLPELVKRALLLLLGHHLALAPVEGELLLETITTAKAKRERANNEQHILESTVI